MDGLAEQNAGNANGNANGADGQIPPEQAQNNAAQDLGANERVQENLIHPENAVQNQVAPVNLAQNQMPPVMAVQNQAPPAYADNARLLQPNLDDWRHLLRALVRNNLQLPEFAGQDHEDPENFLRECDQSFDATNTEAHMRARLASRALKDDAARWFTVYKNLNLTWPKFCELIRNRYASPTTLMKLKIACLPVC